MDTAAAYSIAQRIRLTIQYHGVGSLLYRGLTYPLRFTPLRHRVRRGLRSRRDRAAREWYRRHGRPVAIVIPSYKDAAEVAQLVASLRSTTDARRVSIIVSDDASGPDHLAALRAIEGIRVVQADANAGFAANVNRGIAAAGSDTDVVVLNSDVIARPGWLESLQYATSRAPDVGIVGAKLLYGTDRSSSPARSAISGPRSGLTIAIASGRAISAPAPFLSRCWRSPGHACTSPATCSIASAGSTRPTRWPTRTSTCACAPGRPAFR